MRTGQRAGTGPRLRCATRERRMRGRPAPGRAPPRPVGLNSMLVCRGCRRRRACRGRRLLLVRRRRFPCTRRHLCGPAFGEEATPKYCICQQYSGQKRVPGPWVPLTEHRPFQPRRVGAWRPGRLNGPVRLAPSARLDTRMNRAMFRWVSVRSRRERKGRCSALLQRRVQGTRTTTQRGPTRAPSQPTAETADTVGGVVHALSSAPVLRYLAPLGKGWATPHRP